MRNKFVIKYPTTRNTRRYTTLWNINLCKLACHVCWGIVLLKYELTRDLTYARQQLLMTKTSHSNRFHGLLLLDQQISNWCSIILTRRRTDWLNVILVRKRCSALTFLFFVAADAYSRSCCEFFGWANVNSFYHWTRWRYIIQQLFWADKSRMQFALVSSWAGVSLDTSNEDRCEENDPCDRRLCYLTCWTINFCLVIVA